MGSRLRRWLRSFQRARRHRRAPTTQAP